MLLNVSIAHIQPRIYGFSWTVILICSSQRRGAVVRIPCNHGSTKQTKSAYKEVEMARLHQQTRLYNSFTFINTIG